ncbi:MAG TPA: hypothetical protein VLG67_04435 [Candidatus Saccharimonadales bacterium]|nr:hypothetical protein [Candidatus Saccharimonadales bacterium]
MRTARFIFCLLLIVFCFLLISKPAFAQTPNQTTTTTSTLPFNVPVMDPDVVRNQHTYTQAVTIEVLSAVMCQLTGIDMVDPSSPCLGINPQTGKLGYAASTQSTNDTPRVGGLIGTATDMIAFTYHPIVSTGVYTEYLSSNFGIVKKTYAAPAAPLDGCNTAAVGYGYGFCGLKPIFNLWVASRNVAYALLVFACTFIGIGIMLRVKIDPRTVMTIQNQIPKVIIAIILITFSYAISAMMVDLMWVSTYAGINMILSSNPEIAKIDIGGSTLGSKATRQLMDIPLVYVNDVFHTSKGVSPAGSAGVQTKAPGIAHITDDVSENIGTLIRDIVDNILGVKHNGHCVTFHPLPHLSPKSCVVDFISSIASFVAEIVVFFIILVALFKIWFNLVKAFLYCIFYIILGPLMIVFGLLPTKPMGFENWLRRLFINIAIFPITAFIIVAARVLMEIYSGNQAGQFIPPLIGHNAATNFGSLMALGAIILAPTVQTILRDKMGVKTIGTPGAIGAGLASGAAVVGAPVGRAMKHLNRYDPRTGDTGALAMLKRKTGEKAIGVGAHIPGLKGKSEKALAVRKSIEEGGTAYKYRGEDGEMHSPVEDKLRHMRSSQRQKGESRRTYRDRRKQEKSSVKTPTSTPIKNPPAGGAGGAGGGTGAGGAGGAP